MLLMRRRIWHAAILGALEAGEPERAGEAMADHLKSSFESIIRTITQLPAAQVPGRRPRLGDART